MQGELTRQPTNEAKTVNVCEGLFTMRRSLNQRVRLEHLGVAFGGLTCPTRSNMRHLRHQHREAMSSPVSLTQ